MQCIRCDKLLPVGSRPDRKFCVECREAETVKLRKEAQNRFYQRQRIEMWCAFRFCRQCYELLPIGVDTRRKLCRECSEENRKQRQVKHRATTKYKDKTNARLRAKRASDPEWAERDRQSQRERTKTARSKRWRREYTIKKYGITIADYNAMLAKQDGGCAICGRSPTDSAKGVLAVDHDHDSGDVRGLLCGRCNSALGSLDDSIEILQRAINYLARHQQMKLKVC